MKDSKSPRYPWRALFALTTLLPGLAFSQDDATDDEDEEIIELSPFEVSTDSNVGYLATETLAGTRIRTKLGDVGAAITVVTPEFIQDIGATDNATLLQYTANAEVAGTRGTYAGLGADITIDESSLLINPNQGQRVRGLAAADNTRDFYGTDIPWDSYNVERIDIQRGPNSMLFGLGSPAGIVNAALKDAQYANLGTVEFRIGSYGTLRGNADINREIVEGVFALRVAGLWEQEQFQQKQAFENDERIYLAARFDPKIFGPEFRTTIKAKYESGNIDANRPRIIPPEDRITPWFRPVNTSSLQGGLGKYEITNTYALGVTAGQLDPALYYLAGVVDQQQPLWFMDGATGSTYQINGGYINTGARTNDGSILGAGQSIIGQRWSTPIRVVGSTQGYAENVGLEFNGLGQYKATSLQDDSVFDFYKNLIDGPNKHEWEDWTAYNLTLNQSAWGDRAALEFAFDKQEYSRGGESFIGNPALNIDITREFQDGTSNPNFGRPLLTAGNGSGNSYDTDREYIRASAFYEARASDIFEEDSFLENLFGRHRFNATFSNEKLETETRSWNLVSFDSAWREYWTRSPGNLTGWDQRPPAAIIYLDSSLAGASTAAGANIAAVQKKLDYTDGNVYHFASTWTNFGVNFDDPWDLAAATSSNPVYSKMFDPEGFDGDVGYYTQASNPANYIGWNSNVGVNLLRYNGGQDLSTTRSAQINARKTISYAGSWQGYWWNDAVVTTFGWRYDEVKGRAAVASRVAGNSGILDLSPGAYGLPDAYGEPSSGHTTAGGVVVHLNRLLGKRDFLPLNISLAYNESSTFQVSNIRRNVYGREIGNPTGETYEYGIRLATKDERFSLRFTQYKTSLSNTYISSDTGFVNTLNQGFRFRNVFLYELSVYDWSTRDNPQGRNQWLPVWVDSNGRGVASNGVAAEDAPAGSTYETEAQAIAHRDASMDAWNDIQHYLDERGFFAAWNTTPLGPESAVVNRSEYEANPSAHQPDPATVYLYSLSAPPGFSITGDTESKGFEVELTANPLPNWRIAFNASKTEATRTNIGDADLNELIGYLDEKMAGPAGDMRLWNGGAIENSVRRTNWNGWRGNYTLLKLNEGRAVPEIRKWRFNIVTSYDFDEGFMKGVGIGGAYRWQDDVIIGYPVVDPGDGNVTYDLNNPYYGPSEDGIDLWFSYKRSLTDDIDWKIQLNVRNVGQDNGLVPISVQPDGHTWASVRVKPVQEWFITNTFSF